MINVFCFKEERIKLLRKILAEQKVQIESLEDRLADLQEYLEYPVNKRGV